MEYTMDTQKYEGMFEPMTEVGSDPTLELEFSPDLGSLLTNMSTDADEMYSFFGDSNQHDTAPLEESTFSLLPPLLEPQEMEQFDYSTMPLETSMLVPVKEEEEQDQMHAPVHTPSPSTSDDDMKLGPLPKKAKKEAASKKLLAGKKSEKQREANKLSAQASRQRKKDLKDQLEKQVETLSKSNKAIDKEILELQTENRVLKDEYLHLHKAITLNMPNLLKQKQAQAMETLSRPEGDDPSNALQKSPQQQHTMQQQQQAMWLMYMMLMVQSMNGSRTQTITPNFAPFMPSGISSH